MIRRIVCLLLLFVAMFGLPATSQCASQVVTWGRVLDSDIIPTPSDLTNVVSLAVRSSHILALREDGSVSVWGTEFDGVLDVPPDLPPMASVTVSYGKSGGLTRSGKMAGWGRYFPGHINCDPSEQSQMVMLRADITPTVALRNDGVAGYLQRCHIPAPGRAAHVVSIVANHSRNFAIRSNGTVVALELGGLLGMTPPANLDQVASLSTGSEHVIGLRWDGSIVTWGSNAHGQLDVPVEPTNVVQVAASGNHSLALREDGTVVAWGDNTVGQATVPVDLTNVVAISGSFYGSVALAMDPTSPKIHQEPWGASILSQTPFLMRVEAVGTPRLRYQWRKDGVEVPGATNDFFYLPLSQVDDSGDYTVAVGNHLGTNVSSVASLVVTDTPPVITQTPTNALHSTYGSPVTFSATATGSPPLFYQWQFNGEDIPDATNTSYTVTSPTFASEGEYRVRIWNAYGEEFTEAVPLTLLDVVTVGYAGDPFPTSMSNVVDLAVSGNHILALKANGEVLSWRLAGTDPLSVPPAGISNIVAISAGETHYMALRRDGYVHAWGNDTDGQVSGVNGLTGIKSIASGFDYNLLLTTNDVVLAVGNQSQGQVFHHGTTFPGAVAVASGNSSRTSYVIHEDGSVFAWGQDHHDLLTSAAALQGVAALSGAIYHAAALSVGGNVTVIGNSGSPVSPAPPTDATNVVRLVITGPISPPPSGVIFSYSSAFLALRADGTCITWGIAGPIPDDLRNWSVRAAGLSFNTPVLLIDRTATSRRLAAAMADGSTLDLSIPTTHRRDYLLQACDSLTDGDWTDVQTLPGNGQVRFFDPQIIGSGERYFRLELQETFGYEP
jgi:alpha-tubulin suppressor-like RCC1 family protein